MTFILTNDDGIDAPGLHALQKAVNGKGIVIAPKQECSGCSHRVTTTEAIHVEKRSPTAYAVGGTPVDCIRLAISHLCPDVKWVLSGINRGGNMGVDTYISGTVAAVREAAFHGIPAIAISHYRQGKLNVDWELAAHLTALVLDELFSRPLPPGSFWNVNLPHLPPGAPPPQIVFCPPSIQPLPLKYRVEGEYFYYIGDYASRERAPGTDVDVCFSGNIAVTQLRLENEHSLL